MQKSISQLVLFFHKQTSSICNVFRFYVLKGGFLCDNIYNQFDDSYNFMVQVIDTLYLWGFCFLFAETIKADFRKIKKGIKDKQIFKIIIILFFIKHFVKSVPIRSFFWSVFSCIRIEYGENTDKKKLRILTLFTQWKFYFLVIYSLLQDNVDHFWHNVIYLTKLLVTWCVCLQRFDRSTSRVFVIC